MSLKVKELNICTLDATVGIRLIDLLPPLKRVMRCKICKKEATFCFATIGGGFVLFCGSCFETFNIFYKREIRQREEDGAKLQDELENYS